MPASPTTQPAVNTPLALPWWRFSMAWFVFGLPALVVVCSLVTAAIAWRHADQVVVDMPAQSALATKEGAQRVQGAGVSVLQPALQPAVQARNHAATPKP